MKAKAILITIILILGFSYANASPSTKDMALHGKGKAYYLKFIKVYDAAMYTEQSATEEEIRQGAVSKCLLLQYDVSIKKQDVIKAANIVLDRQLSPDQLDKVRDEIDLLHDNYLDVKDGDKYSLCYDRKEKSTTLSHNGICCKGQKQGTRMYIDG